MIIFRRLLGEVLRSRRVQQGRTLRDISGDARVSLGYISEVERGQKEASSELLAAICAALDVPLSEILSEVSDAVALEEARIAMALESIEVPDTVPSSLKNDLKSDDVDEHGGDVVASAA